jgi:ABC-type phosphate/phosphonate transport system permease subunit
MIVDLENFRLFFILLFFIFFSQSAIRIPKSAFRNPKSSNAQFLKSYISFFFNPHSAIRIPQSEIRNPHSAIKRPTLPSPCQPDPPG